MGCETCGDLGFTCCDDMCRGSGECIHGDSICPTCHGDPDNEYGLRPDDDSSDDYDPVGYPFE